MSSEDAGFISDVMAARQLRIKSSTLANWRWRGQGPPYYKIGNQVLYREAEVSAWIMSSRVDFRLVDSTGGGRDA